ncbi:hypothetical protein BN2537_15521 [Streptomyces venezuelae]|nr:hypothetical protein BN2537_15521 [Streptomyces venezuelae]
MDAAVRIPVGRSAVLLQNKVPGMPQHEHLTAGARHSGHRVRLLQVNASGGAVGPHPRTFYGCRLLSITFDRDTSWPY